MELRDAMSAPTAAAIIHNNGRLSQLLSAIAAGTLATSSSPTLPGGTSPNSFNDACTAAAATTELAMNTPAR